MAIIAPITQGDVQEQAPGVWSQTPEVFPITQGDVQEQAPGDWSLDGGLPGVDEINPQSAGPFDCVLAAPLPTPSGFAQFRVFAFLPATVDDTIPGTSVLVEGSLNGAAFVPIYDSAAFQAGFSGSIVVNAPVNGLYDYIRFEWEPAGGFSDGDTWDLRVSGQDSLAQLFLQTWTMRLCAIVAAPPYLINRTPAAEASGVVFISNIAFAIKDDFNNVDASTVVIEVDYTSGAGTAYETIYDASSGGFQGGVTGGTWAAGSSVPVINAPMLSVVLNPPINLPAATQIFVRVAADDETALSMVIDNAGAPPPPPGGPNENPYRFTTAAALADQPYLKDYFPLPGATGVSGKTKILFSIADDTFDVDYSTIVISVDITGTGTNYLVVFTGGAFQVTVDGAWTGQVLPAIDAPEIDCVLEPPVTLPSGASIFVQVNVSNVSPTPIAVWPVNPPPPVSLGTAPKVFWNPTWFITSGPPHPTRPYLDKRNPQPEQTDVPLTKQIVFTIRDNDDGVDLTSVIIDVDVTSQVGTALTRVWDNILGWQNLWTGVIFPQPNGRDFTFTLTAPAPFAVATYIVVRVTNAADVGVLLLPVDLGPPPYAGYFSNLSAQAVVNSNPWRFLTQGALPVEVVPPPDPGPGQPKVPPGTPANVLPKDGGYPVYISAQQGQVPEGRYRVYLGPDGGVLGPGGNPTDPICYSGVSGQGNVVIVEPTLDALGEPIPGATEFSFVTPPYLLTSADETPPGPFDIFMINLDDGSTILIPDMITIIPHEFRGDTLKLRKSLDPKWVVGYLEPGEEEFPQ